MEIGPNKNEPSATLNDQHEISPDSNEAEFGQREEKKPPNRLSLLYARMKQSGYLEVAALTISVRASAIARRTPKRTCDYPHLPHQKERETALFL
jgi:hypothetical protein